MNEDFGDLSQTLQDLDINTELPTMEPEISSSYKDEKNPVVDKFTQDPKGPPLPPFPELRYLNLSSNLVCMSDNKIVNIICYNNSYNTCWVISTKL